MVAGRMADLAGHAIVIGHKKKLQNLLNIIVFGLELQI